MEEWFSSGRIAEAILVLMLAEGLAFTALYRATGHGPSPKSVWTNLLAGAALVLALRSALAGDGWQMTALWLTAGLVAHAADMYVRWRND